MKKHRLPLACLLGVSGFIATAAFAQPNPATPVEGTVILPVAPETPPAPAVSKPLPIKYRTSDCHLHLVDFLQKGDGAKAAIEAMDRAGVDHAMISGMPLVKQWSEQEPVQPGYYLEDDARCYWYSATDVLVARDVQSLPEASRKRLHPMICGFNGADRNAVDHVIRMLEWYPNFWEGIGEIMARHDDLTALTYGETTLANNSGLDRVYKLAAERNLPVWVHSNISSVWKRDPLYVNEIEGAVKANPKTRFVWCHAGISRRVVVPSITTEIERMLTAYPNLWVDLSWVVFEEELMKGGKPNPAWIALIEKFPTRFMIGSDKVGRFANYHEEMQKYYVFLDALKPATVVGVARNNFLNVLPKNPDPRTTTFSVGSTY